MALVGDQTDAPERENAGGLASLGNVDSPPGDPERYVAGNTCKNLELSERSGVVDA